MTIGSQYSSPSSPLHEDLMEWQHSKGFSKKSLVLADLNAHSVLWGYARDNERGQVLINHLHRENLIVLNDPFCSPTFETNHSRGWPDVSLSSFELFPFVDTWMVEEDLNYADHKLITITLKLTIEKLPRRRYKTKNRSFKNFNHLLTTQIHNNDINFDNIEMPEQFDRKYAKFQQSIIDTCNKTFKKKASSFRPVVTWWNNKLRTERNLVRALYRRAKQMNAVQQDILRYKEARARYRKNILEAKKTAWEHFCRNIKDPFGKAKAYAFEEFYNKETYSLANSQEITHSRENFYIELTTEIFGQSKFTETQKICPQKPSNLFKESEIKSAIYSFSNRKAPGVDNIDLYVIKNIFLHHGQLLTNMFNALLKLNYFPTIWKKGELVYFLKKNKNPELADSYRPITLLPFFGKIYEKLILKRVMFQLSSTEDIDKAQHGFSDNRSTETAIQDLFSLIDLKSQKSKYVSLLSIDFKNAFDLLPWGITLEEIKNLDIDEAYQNVFFSYLSIRCAYVNWLFKFLHHFYRGCPQGSCLGPFLWKIFINKLLKTLRRYGIDVIAYADDVILVISGNSRRDLENNGNEALEIIRRWVEANGMKLSLEKCFSLNLKNLIS